MLGWLNNLHDTIKFTMEVQNPGLSFLDTYLTIENNAIRIRPYTKSTDTKQYLSPSSCHPPHNINSIPYSQALRILRICSHPSDADRELKNLEGFFLNRNYKPELVQHSFAKAYNDYSRAPSDNEAPTKGKKSKGPVLVVPYNPNNPPYQTIINKIHNKFKSKIRSEKPIVGYYRPKNLRDLLTKARLPTDTVPKRKLTTVTRNCISNKDLKKEHDYITMRCQKDHRYTSDLITTLEQAYRFIDNPNSHHFTAQHKNCGKIVATPVQAMTDIQVKCTECQYRYKFSTATPPTRYENELRTVVTARQEMTFRRLNPIRSCLNFRCTCCRYSITPGTINTGTKAYRLLPMNCKAENVVYILQCALCDKIYVGQTGQRLRARFNSHKNSIDNRPKLAVGQHFNEPGHSKADLRIGILDQCTREQLNYREAYWIHELKSVDTGLNRKNERNHKLTLQSTHISEHFTHSKTCFPYCMSTIHSEKNI